MDRKSVKTFWDYSNSSPEADAVIEIGVKTWSRREVYVGSRRIRDSLELLGITPQDAVAIIAPNGAEFVVAYMGITVLGATAVPVNHHLTIEELVHVFLTSKAACALVHRSLLEKVARVIQAFGPGGPRLVPLETMHEEPHAASSLENLSLPEQLGRTMLFTSATTGAPKAIIHSSEDTYKRLARLVALREAIGVRCDSHAVHLCASALYHAGPLEGAYVSLHMGNCVAVMRTWDSRVALRAIGEHRVTQAYLVPIMLAHLAKIPVAERSQYDLSSLKLVHHGGAPCPVETKRSIIDWFGPIVCEGYAATEGGGTFVTSLEWLRFPGTVGKPIPGATIAIRSPEGDLLPRGKTGLIYMKSFTGEPFEYLGKPEETRKCFIGDQFTVGDIGYLNEEGYLFIRDRASNLILFGGINIYPAEVEKALMEHPFVSDCAVVGKPNQMFGETVHAIVQPTADSGMTVAQLRKELIRHACSKLAPSKLPRTIEFVDAIPRDPNGKLMKRRLNKGNAVENS